jgi:predicted transcriptional regulator
LGRFIYKKMNWLCNLPSKPRRNKLELYNDILKAIGDEIANDDSAAVAIPTRVQLRCNLAYDKLTRYLDELENRKMILQSPLLITERGRDFLQDYGRISSFVLEMGIKYLDIPPDEMKGA